MFTSPNLSSPRNTGDDSDGRDDGDDDCDDEKMMIVLMGIM